MKFIKYVLAFALLGALVTCKKYPEDDKFHLSTAKGRLTNSWYPLNAHNFNTNKDIGFSPISDGISFAKNGEFGGHLCANYFNYSNVYISSSATCTFKGTWRFIDKKNKLEIIDALGVSGVFSIKKLDNDELWLQNDSMLFKFVPSSEIH